MISVHFQGKPLKVTIIHVYAPTTHLKKLKLNGFMMTYKTYSPWGRKESDMTERLHFHFSLSWIGEGNGNPLQCSSLENPRDRGAWWVAVYGVTQSRTQLKQLSSSSMLIHVYSSLRPLLCHKVNDHRTIQSSVH